MLRREFLSLGAGAAAGAAAGAPRPNIVLIVGDDLGYSDLGCYGGEIRTPHLDRLAAEGVRFTQFYNCAVCVVTRAALMTGLHPRFGKEGHLRPNMATLAEVLRDAGYQTAMTGKWHLGNRAPRRPIDRGFDEYYGMPTGACNYWDPSIPDPPFEDGGRTFVHNEKEITRFPEGFYTTDAFSGHAAETIRKLAGNGKPFFLHVAYNAPHFPLHAWPEDIARYRGQYAMGYLELRRRRYRRQLALGVIQPRWVLSAPDSRLGGPRYDYDIEPWEAVDQARQQRLMEVYAAMVDRMDQGIGRILRALEETKAAQNTVVIFFSDNGGCAELPVDRASYISYNAGKEIGTKESYELVGPGWGWAQSCPFRRHKTWTYEGGISTPMIVRWPGVVRPGTITHQVAHVVDIMPSFAELAGARYPSSRDGQPVPPVEGLSLAPVLRGQERQGHDYLGWHLFGNRAVRQGNWKLVWGHNRRRWELFDMEKDRTETQNLAEARPDVVASLSKLWEEWARRSEVP